MFIKKLYRHDHSGTIIAQNWKQPKIYLGLSGPKNLLYPYNGRLSMMKNDKILLLTIKWVHSRNLILNKTRPPKIIILGFPGGAVVEDLPANAGDTGSSPGLGRSHMPWSGWAREPQLLSLRVWSLCSATREAAIVRGPRTVMKSGPRLPQLEKALGQRRGPNTAIKKKNKKKNIE